MKRYRIIKFTALTLILTGSLAACRKDDTVENPEPVEQELITTMKLVVTNSAGFNKSFVYKVENGFGSGQSNIHIDDIVLTPATEYDVEIQMLNEKETPAEDITEEIKTENTEHLFIYQSVPATGAGSIAISDGNLDDQGKAFNQKVKFTTGAAGTGALTITLKHEPVDKAATTPDAAGGETDAEAVFPVKIQ